MDSDGVAQRLGLGETSADVHCRSSFPYRDLSVCCGRMACQVPVTVHVGIGYDIIHEHPNCDGAALGDTSYRDFLDLRSTMERLEGGVLLNFGSAIMGPEVYLKGAGHGPQCCPPGEQID